MTFDPTSIEPPDELIRKRAASHTTFRDDYIFFARWGVRQAVEALRHQWPEPITDRPPTKEDGDDDDLVQYLFCGKWESASFQYVANSKYYWLHTSRWRPKPEPSPKQRALEIVKHIFPCTPRQAKTLLAALALIPDAPDTTP
jgi:hypothetical protein